MLQLLTVFISAYWKCRFLMVFFFIRLNIYLFIWPHRVLAAACELLVAANGIEFPDQGSNPDPLLWERRALATGPPGKSCFFIFLYHRYYCFYNKKGTVNVYSCLCPFLKPAGTQRCFPYSTPLRQEQKGLSVSFCRLCVSFLIHLPQQPRDNEGVTRTQRKGGGHKGRGMLPPR